MSEVDTVDLVVDVICPYGDSLLMRLITEGDHFPVERMNGNKMQLHCKGCSRDVKKILVNQGISRVLHIYDMNGTFMYTKIQFHDGDDKTVLNHDAFSRIIDMRKPSSE